MKSTQPDIRGSLTRDPASDGIGGGLRAFLHRRIAHLLEPRPGEEVDELGVPIRAYYHMLFVFCWSIGAVPLALSFTAAGEELTSPVLRGLCLYSIAIAPLYLIAGRRLDYRRDDRVYNLGGVSATIALIIGSFFTGDLRGPLIATMLAPPMAMAYFATSIRVATAHIVFGTVSIVTVAAFSYDTDSALRAVVLGIVLVGGAVMVITTKRRLTQSLEVNRDLSESDALTGAANLRKLDSRLRDEIARATREESTFALLAIDLDDFKSVNDRYSHSVGDHVLAATAAGIQAELTPVDLLVRRGGDEFTVVAPLFEGRDLDSLAQRVSARVATARGEICPDVTPNATVAVVRFRAGEAAAGLMTRADDALHRIREEARGAARVIDIANFREQPISTPAGPAGDARSKAKRSVNSTGDPEIAATASAWRVAAMLMVVTPVALLLLVLSGQSALQLNAVVLGASVASVMSAPACWWLSTRTSYPGWVREALSLGMIAVISVGLVGAGDLSPALVDLLLLPIVFQMYVLPPRLALKNTAITLAVYGGFLIINDYPDTMIRWSITASNIGTVSLMLAATRKKTVEVATENARLAETDALTGLPNVRRLRGRLSEEIERSSLIGGGFCLLMLDLDDFKLVNDLHSHTLGDRVLKDVAGVLRDQVRKTELPARRGGDEFAVIMTGADEREAELTAHRIGEGIALVRGELCPDVTPTASIGWVAWEPGDTVESLLSRADDALHEKKARTHARRLVNR